MAESAVEPEQAPGSPADALAKQIEAFAAQLEAGEGTPSHAAPAEPHRELPVEAADPATPAVASSEVRPLAAPVPAPDPAPQALVEPQLPADLAPEAPDPQVLTAASAREVVDPLVGRVRRQMEASPGSLASVVDYELLRLVEDEPGAPQLASDGEMGAYELSREDAVILESLREGLAEFRQGLRPGESAAEPLPADKIRPLVDMVDRLQEEVGLTLPTVALCSDVRLFGNYEELPTPFQVGRQRRAVLYVEVDHFTSRQVSSSDYETVMTLGATLYDPEGNPVLEIPDGEAVDRSSRKRRDFYMVRIVTLPAVSTPGDYTLKVTVVDKLGGRIAQDGIRVAYE